MSSFPLEPDAAAIPRGHDSDVRGCGPPDRPRNGGTVPASCILSNPPSEVPDPPSPSTGDTLAGTLSPHHVSTTDAQPGANAPSRAGVDPLAAAFGALVPGLGHWVRGERRRGRLIFTGVVGLFVSGVLVGGIDVVDRVESRVWFVGQAGVGPVAFGVDWINQNIFKGVDRSTGARRSALPGETIGPGGWIEVADPGQRPPKMRSVAKVNELGTLFCAVAGMLNLVVVFDALFPGRGVGASRRDDSGSGGAP